LVTIGYTVALHGMYDLADDSKPTPNENGDKN
jgi:hypothetical protein